MSHSRILATYVGLSCLLATTLGGYVACGAQTYRVAVDDDMGNPALASQGELNRSLQNGSGLMGVHSGKGWGKQIPIRFRTSETISEAKVAELMKAMATWEAAIGRKLFEFDGHDPRTGDSFQSLYAPLADNVNGHYFDFNWSAATGKPRTVLATTIWENDPKDSQTITKADIRYNSEVYIFGDSLSEFSQGSQTIVDLESLALHELGHLIGLGHISTEEDRFSVMNPALFIGEGMITRRLSKGDIERVRTVYGVGDPTMAEQLEIADDSPVHE